MEKILQAIALLLFLILINLIFKRWVKKYEEKNGKNFNESSINTHSELIHYKSKLAYKGTLFIILFLIIQIIYLTIDYYFL
jgi:hypothetical protein